jgi:NAD(P) transhydrogenase subunit alpha
MELKIGIPKETTLGETRVALVPANVPMLVKKAGKGRGPSFEVLVETGAGVSSMHADADYEKAGARIVANPTELYASADILLKVSPPIHHPKANKHEIAMLREGAVIAGFLSPLTNLGAVRMMIERRITSFSLEYVPRITRAQSMDALSSMSTVSGYKAVLIAAHHLGKMFPLLMTAAGTVPPAHVLVLGAGVAGLQAIATAKRLGAKVEAFDPRPVVKEQVKSLGAAFIDMEVMEDVETAGGYAKEQSAAFLKREQEVIAERLPKTNVVVSTAQVFGKKAPVLITEDMVKMMRPGSVIVDLAAEQGGNCELTTAGKTVERHGVTIVGVVNLPATVPADASLMYSKNIVNFLQHVFEAPEGTLNFDDEITRGACITHDGKVLNPTIQSIMEQGGSAK